MVLRTEAVYQLRARHNMTHRQLVEERQGGVVVVERGRREDTHHLQNITVSNLDNKLSVPCGE
jgi:hypothetical protein